MENWNVPGLRFGEFEEEWKVKSLGELANFSKGKNISKADITSDGKYPCIRYGELYTTYGEIADVIVSRTDLPEKDLVFSKADDVIIPASGETQIDIATATCVMAGGIALSGDLNILRTKLHGPWLAYSIGGPNKSRIAKMGQGNSVVHLYSKQLKSVQIAFPTLPEQKKIATFLTAVDGRLAGLRRQRALLGGYKRGVMQRVFSGEGIVEWERFCIGELYTFYSTNSLSRALLNYEGGKAKNIHYGDIHTQFSQHLDARKTIIPFINDGVEKKGAAFKQQVEAGDILMADASEDINDIGKATEVIDAGDIPLYAGLHTIHGRPKADRIALGFGSLLFQSQQFRRQVSKIAQGAKVLGISPTSISGIELNVPPLEEQRRIATFLRALDDRIALVERQLAGAEAFKRGLLQGMFV
jgi:type I restriction enzyme S subunit